MTGRSLADLARRAYRPRAFDHVLVDGQNAAYRAWYTQRRLHVYAADGALLPTGVAYGLVEMLAVLRRNYRGALHVVWEGGKARRRAIWYGYKASREDRTPAAEAAEFWAAVDLARDVLDALGVPQYRVPGEEADDVLATLARGLPGARLLVSGDHDFWQLLALPGLAQALPEERGRYRLVEGAAEVRALTAEKLKLAVGLTPFQMNQLMAVMGDPGDDVPGLYKVGPAKGAALVRGYPAHVWALCAGRPLPPGAPEVLREPTSCRLPDGTREAVPAALAVRRAHRLTRLYTVPGVLAAPAARPGRPWDAAAVEALFEGLQFNSLLSAEGWARVERAFASPAALPILPTGGDDGR